MRRDNIVPNKKYSYSNQKIKASPTATSSRIVTCSLCGRPLSISVAYCVINGPNRKYYCSKEEYDGGAAYVAMRDKYENSIKDYVKSIIQCDVEIVTFNSLLSIWLQDASYKKIYYYLYDNENTLRNVITNKAISGGVQKLKYLSAIIVNNIVDYNPNTSKGLVGPDSSLSDTTDYNIYMPRTCPRKGMRRSMEELEEIYSEQDQL